MVKFNHKRHKRKIENWEKDTTEIPVGINIASGCDFYKNRNKIEFAKGKVLCTLFNFLSSIFNFTFVPFVPFVVEFSLFGLTAQNVIEPKKFIYYDSQPHQP